MKGIKLIGILCLCTGFINHLVDAFSLAFGLERDIYRFIFGFIGYMFFYITWRIDYEDK